MADLWATYIWPTALIVVYVLAILVPLLLAVAYLTYAERKVLAAVHLRRGPNVVGPFGLLQPFADALKLLTKETVIPSGGADGGRGGEPAGRGARGLAHPARTVRGHGADLAL